MRLVQAAPDPMLRERLIVVRFATASRAKGERLVKPESKMPPAAKGNEVDRGTLKGPTTALAVPPPGIEAFGPSRQQNAVAIAIEVRLGVLAPRFSGKGAENVPLTIAHEEHGRAGASAAGQDALDGAAVFTCVEEKFPASMPKRWWQQRQ